MTFPEYEWGTRCNSQIVDWCTESCLACSQTHINYFEAGKILRSCRSVRSNDSKVCISVILVVKAKFSTTGSSKKMSTNKCDIDKHRKYQYGYPNRKYTIYIFEGMTDITKIPTANLRFSTEGRLEKVSAVIATADDNRK